MDNQLKSLEAIIDGIPDPVMVIGKDYIVTFLNRAARNKLGADNKALNGLHCYEVPNGRSVPCDASREVCPLDKVFKTGKHVKTYHQHHYTNGHREIVEIDAVPIFDDQGAVIAAEEIHHWVSDQDSALRLLDCELRLRSIVESASDAIITTDGQGMVVYANTATTMMFGYTLQEILESPAALFLPEQQRSQYFSQDFRPREDAVERMVGKVTEITCLRKDGSEMDVELSLSICKSGDNVYYNAIVRDITARKRAEAEIQANRELVAKERDELSRMFRLVETAKREWERAMDCVGDMVVLVDDRNRVKRCNKTFKHFTGKSFEGILGHDWNTLLAEQEIDIGTNAAQGAEFYHQRSNCWFTVSSYPVMDIGTDGSTGVVITFHDSTARRTMTQRLEETNQEIEKNRTELSIALNELSSLIQRVAKEKTFGIRFHNPNLVPCYDTKKCNKQSCPCFGKDAARCWQIVGTHCGGKVQGEFAQKYENCVDCSVFQASTQNPVFRIGEHFNNMMSILELKNHELENAYNELKIAQGKVIQQEKMASIGQLAAGVAHEINNPTGFIMSNLGTLQKYVDRITEFIRIQTESLAGLPAESAEAVTQQRKALKVDFITDDLKSLVKESLEGADRIKKIVQDLKNFSRVDEAEMKMADINSGIESTINIVWNELKYKATLKKEYGNIPQTKCNPGQLNQIFMNILVNAAHAIEKQGEIGIRTWAVDNAIKVTIADTGCGIPKDKINRIFEPFYTTKEVGKGTGLGLSIAYDIVKKHNGMIDVKSEVGKGTTFTVTIPITGS